ncbi:MAG TPA: glycerate kinase [Dehalococcoidia bacterium]|nr:glycerate kinase [Dehalococcoidia bacterium]
MKIVIAPQSFKGSLSAHKVADAMARGICRVLSNVELVKVPMADGGEGTVDVLVSATGGSFRYNEVTGPLGEKVTAKWGILGDGTTAVIEMAAASGITLVKPDRLDPMVATTYGTGELIKAALEAGCHHLIIGIGGSATNDGGAGMAQALGVSLLDEEGNELLLGGAELLRLSRIDTSGLDTRLVTCRVTVAIDVTNPLYGDQGASWIYGPQKGATEEMCRQLDETLEHYATIIKRDLDVDVGNIPGGGAAGGLGAGLVAFLGAKLEPGIDIVCEAVGLSEHLKGANIVFTGEGRIDAQTMFGKTIAGVAAKAQALGVPMIAIAGEINLSSEELARHGIDIALSLVSDSVSPVESIANASQLITEAAERALRLAIDKPSTSLESPEA